VNALDAAVLAYTGISVLRQQMHPSCRVHCIISDGGERPNVIPRSAALDCYVRCPNLKMADELLAKVKNCFQGAALQSGCEVDIQL
jgi:metal-dependent amidase/aminoacylase/carboxypeptidase family protein